MRRTVSLRRRVVLGGALVLTVMLVALDVLVYLALRDQLYDQIELVLSDRAILARELAEQMSREELATALGGGVVGVSVGGPGSVSRVVPPSGPAQRAAPLEGPLVSYRVVLPGGPPVVLTASAAPAEASLRRLLIVEILGTGAAIVLGALALDRIARRALRPVDDVVDLARRIAAGGTGERLAPARTDTELGRIAVAFDEMLESLEQAIASSRQAEARARRFLADAAHELRTPLTGAQASAEALLRHSGDRDRLLVNVVGETSRAGRILGALLQVARLDAEAALNLQVVDVTELCRREIERAAIRAAHLTVDLAGPAATVNGDPDALRGAIANLIDNSLRHARSTVSIVVYQEPTGVIIEVADDGPGLPADRIEAAFARFVSLDGAGGSGLGLPIARAVAEAHSGSLVYEQGRFRLELPAFGAPG